MTSTGKGREEEVTERRRRERRAAGANLKSATKTLKPFRARNGASPLLVF